MKILVAVLCTTVCVFALASAWSDMLQPQVEVQQRAAESRAASALRRAASRVARPVAAPAGAEEKSESVRAMPKSPRPQVVDTGAATDASNPVTETRSEGEALLLAEGPEAKQRESRLMNRQESLRMIYDDIREEQAAVDDIRRQATEELAAAEQRAITASQRVVKASQQDAGAGERKPTAGRQRTEAGEITVNRPIVNSDSPSVRAAVLLTRRLVAQGSHDTAASILGRMQEREAAKVLTALAKEDAPLAKELAVQLQAAKQAARSE